MRGVFSIPLWVMRPLMFLGVVWLVLGLGVAPAVYVLSLILAIGWGYSARRRFVSVVLEKSDDHGLIVWHRRRADVKRNPLPTPHIEFPPQPE
jgi:hypothetical protein